MTQASIQSTQRLWPAPLVTETNISRSCHDNSGFNMEHSAPPASSHGHEEHNAAPNSAFNHRYSTQNRLARPRYPTTTTIDAAATTPKSAKQPAPFSNSGATWVS
ncbi:hypothetical protein VF21_06578 [Pseudogymnoascus sp. 05NY08]|nr:hypothetical protein VF21_06578 [Pseudogymnoascus sp. 05NY08]